MIQIAELLILQDTGCIAELASTGFDASMPNTAQLQAHAAICRSCVAVVHALRKLRESVHRPSVSQPIASDAGHRHVGKGRSCTDSVVVLPIRKSAAQKGMQQQAGAHGQADSS